MRNLIIGIIQYFKYENMKILNILRIFALKNFKILRMFKESLTSFKFMLNFFFK